MAILQKYIDQAISVNTSYNPQFYEEDKIPMSEMMRHLVMHYKYGGKTLYYFNTFDGAGEVDVDKLHAKSQMVEAPTTLQEDDDCEACKI
jgi:ribonucleoside-diphosphate reductase alpha chain